MIITTQFSIPYDQGRISAVVIWLAVNIFQEANGPSYRQTYMDYSICKAASYNSSELEQLLIIYDIGCQWSKNFPDRLRSNPQLSLPVTMKFDKINYVVGKFHLSVHVTIPEV